MLKSIVSYDIALFKPCLENALKDIKSSEKEMVEEFVSFYDLLNVCNKLKKKEWTGALWIVSLPQSSGWRLASQLSLIDRDTLPDKHLSHLPTTSETPGLLNWWIKISNLK